MAVPLLLKFNRFNHNFKILWKSSKYELPYSQTITTRSSLQLQSEDEFRVLELYPSKQTYFKKGRSRFFDAQVLPPREKRMPIDIDWPSVWPAAKTFRPSVVPLPIHQGYDQKRAPPTKHANAELLKIPNFLHLTPPAIKRHCAAIKKFCTQFPSALTTDKACLKHFPVEIVENDYCHSAPTIRDERSRIVTLTVKLSELKLDYHGRDKIIRLLGKEYFKDNETIVLVADRCPLRKQNYQYLIYLLTALHHESCVTEPWEHEKTEADMEKFFFEGSRIQNKITKTILKIKSSAVTLKENLPTEVDVKESKEIEMYGKAVSAVINEKENKINVKEYKEAVLKSLSLAL